MPRKAQYLASFLLLSLAFSSCSRLARSEPVKESGASDAEAEADKAVTVAVARVERKDLSQGLTLAAEFRPFQEIDLHAKVAGYLKEINVDVGDRVKDGQVIATLEIPEFKSELLQAEATKRRSESDVVRARSELQRAQSVYEAARLTHSRLSSVGKARPNLLAQQEIDDALAKLQVAEAQLNAARAAITVAEEQVRVQEANEARVKTLSSYAVISAPFSGVITKRFADKGALIQQGTASQTQAMPVVRLSQIDHLRLVLPVPESVVPRIRLGRTVKVKVTSLNQTFDGKVSRFAEKVETATRTMETEVDVPNPRLILKPGMYAYADLELEQKANAITVPVQAVSRKEKKATVMLVNAQKRLELREIVTGMETPLSVEVVAGLSEGNLIVIGNQSQLKPGQFVEPKISAQAEIKGETKAVSATTGGGR
ncbi:MAG TPA: efflux RND transporter periplasmic adaptor subunit [Pyrinomonadaceae bacterium]|nr:efflux RND transporter periplasmic adaptor subunit [Pyrinomonadaceae bacterium]